jgi:RHS repeat-associated protein/uncharacterized repeat protein (TIGR01451 family)
LHLVIEPLEPRQLLATVQWISTSSGAWDVGSNWSTGQVPGSGDDVVINVKGATPTVTIDSGNQSVHSLMASDPLSITGGSLTVAASSTISGGLTMTGGSLIATGSGVSLTADGSTSVTSASLEATSGAVLSLPNLTSYAITDSGEITTLEASGLGSTLSLPELTSIAGFGGINGFLKVQALAGGQVQLPVLATINPNSAGATNTAVGLTADGASSQIDVSHLTTYLGGGPAQNAIMVTNGGTVLDGALTSPDHVNLDLDGTSTLATSQWTSYTGATATIAGGTPDFSKLATITGSGFTASGGAQVTLPAVTNYAIITSGAEATLEASGSGSTLSLPKLTSISGFGGINGFLKVQALAGGQVQLPVLTTINPGSAGAGDTSVGLTADGAGSEIDVSRLTTYVGGTTHDAITVTNGGTILDGTLTSPQQVYLYLDGTGTLATSQWTSYTGATATIAGGTPDFSKLATITGSGFTASGGAQVTLPAVTSYAITTSGAEASLEASGSGSTLSLPKLTSISGFGGINEFLNVQALAGAQVQLPVLATINPNSAGATNTAVGLTADGASSQIDVSHLTTYLGGGPAQNAIMVTNGGTVLEGALTSPDHVNLDLDGTSTLATSQWTSYTGATATIAGGTPDFSKLATITGSSFVASGGAQVTLPEVTSYAITSSGVITMLEATGSGSKLRLPALTSIAGFGGINEFLNVQALAGAQVQLPVLATINPNSAGATNTAVGLTADGASSQIDVSHLTTYLGGGPAQNAFTASNGGAIDGGALATLDSCNITVVGPSALALPMLATGTINLITVSGGGTLNMPVLRTGNVTLNNGSNATIQGTLVSSLAATSTGAAIDAPASQGLTINILYSGTATGTTFNVGPGTTLVLEGGTYMGGTTFNVGPGATVDLTGGETVTYGGTLTGSGAGTVQFSGGTFYPALGGVTLNFPGSMFQWTGGKIDAQVGDVKNLGTMNLAGSNDKAIYNDGTLDDFGTIIQTGSGNLRLHSDNVSATTLKIETGASYLIESDSGVDNASGGATALVNAGLIRKTTGSNTSTLDILGTITNTGTMEADSGTLYLDGTSISQVSSNSLNGGTWNALNGATLQLPSGTSITTNAANISLSGAGAAITGLGGLATNSGSLSLTGGASFTTTAALTNSGTLTVGAGSTLSVGGNFSQTSAGTLNTQISGQPASGLFSQLKITGSATLGGNFQLTLPSGFAPGRNAVYPVMTFASESGSFARVGGLVSSLTENLGTTQLDLQVGTGTPVDLELSQPSAPAQATTGQPITGTWQVKNAGSNAATGAWQDSVYLSTAPAIISTSILLGSVTHTGGLAAGASYNGSLTAPVPALAPGNYYVLVQADSLDQVLVTNRADDTLAASTGELALSVPALTLGTATHGTFTAADQNQYYQVSVPAGGALVIALASSAASGSTALYVSQGVLPTPYSYQDAADVANQPNQTVTVPQVLAAGTYYVLAHSIAGFAATAGYTLTATQTGALAISAISSYAGGNGGNVSIEIDGTNFTPGTTATLTLGTTTLTATTVDFVSSGQLFATFDLVGAAIGEYRLSVQQEGQSAGAASTFSVVAASAGSLDISISTPQYVRAGRTATIVISYSNPTDDDMVAPLLDISSTNSKVLFSTPDDPNSFVQDGQVLAVAASSPAGILRPGQSGQITLSLLSDDTINNDQIPVQVGQLASGQTIDWASEQASLQPTSMPTAAWEVIFGNVLATVGTTTDSYDAALAQAATYLGGLGDGTAEVSDVGRLWAFLVAQADASFPGTALTSAMDASVSTPGDLALAIDRTFNADIAGRYTSGIFGLGWTTSWQTSLNVDTSGNVTIDSGGAVAYFGRQANGSYLDTDGEYGTLTNSAGVYTFTDTTGVQYVFLPDGQLSYERDTNGNRITLGYNSSNQLVTLTYSNPADPSEPDEQLTLAYYTTGPNAGLVQTVSDGTGDTWTYSYDGSGHLASVTSPGTGPSSDPGTLTTSYTYDTGTNPETANALLSITNPDGSQQTFTYDTNAGRRTGTAQPDGPLTISTTYSYLGEAEVMATDAAGNQATVWFNDLGLPARVEDPRGGISTYLYDPNGNLVSYADASGAVYQYAYDSNGNLTQVVNPLGQVDKMTDGPLSDLTSLTDAAGNTTAYSYSSAGNLLSITYPDGTQQSFSYDPLGNLSQTVLQNGDPIGYKYNSQGLVTQESFADKTSETFAYDTHGNLLSAETFDAAGTLTGTTTLTYNAADELISVTYPSGQFLKFAYNAAGQRTQSIDQSGFTVNYKYDSLGRLSELTDGSGNLIVQYTYNDLGELVEKQNGNGTYTTYAYDKNGNLLNEVNYANSTGSVVNSSFTYVYNSLSEETSMTDASGNTTLYAYDPTGQLTEVTLPGGATIQYVYNAAGDRTEVIQGGTTTSYSSNADNEITQVGSATYSYDANGNLHTVTDASGTSVYTYNDLNELVSITNPDGSVQSFQYSPLGFMVGVSTTSAGTSSATNYLVDPTGIGNVVAAYNGTGSLIANYAYGLGLVSQSGPRGTGFYDFDASGSAVGITGSSGSYVNRYSYLPFGETTTLLASLPNPFTFAGSAGGIAGDSGLVYLRSRFYDPSLGQFASNDSLGLAGGDANVRRYVQNAPTTFADPTGTGSGCGCSTPFLGAMPRTLNNQLLGQDLGYYDAHGLAPQHEYFLNPDGSYFGVDGLVKQTSNPTAYTPLVGFEDPEILTQARELADAFTKGSAHDNSRYDVFMGFSGQPFATDRGSNCQTYANLVVEYYILLGGRAKWYDPAYYNEVKKWPAIKAVLSTDPNALVGPAGYGSQAFAQPIEHFAYTIDFENDGTAAAQNVSVTEQLDPNLNWSTFQLGSFGFGPINVTVPPGLTDYETTVAYQNTDCSSLKVQVAADFNVQTGLLSVTFTSIDPLTGQAPAGVFDGFLPPNNSSNVGEGYVQYTIQPKAGLATGATINQQASVVFDINAPISTNTAVNTIDTTVPTSSVAALPATVTTPNFTVKWSGSDGNGSGIAGYNVYVSDNGGAYALWQSNTTNTSATYAGQVGHTYSFYSVATSNVGLVQPTPTAAQATTKVVQVTVQPPAIVTSVKWTTVSVKTGSAKKAKTKSEQALQITFSEPVSGAANLRAYDLSTVTTKKVKKKPVTKLKPVTLSSALPASSPRTTSVKLVPAGKVKPGQTYELEIIAADIIDAQGRRLDGKDNGQAGSNFVAKFGSDGLTFSQPSAAVASSRLSASAVDAVLPRVNVRRRVR